jgi:hypothetical protein
MHGGGGDPKTVVSECVDSINLAEDWNQWLSVASRVMRFLVPQKAGNFSTSGETSGFQELPSVQLVGLQRKIRQN